MDTKVGHTAVQHHLLTKLGMDLYASDAATGGNNQYRWVISSGNNPKMAPLVQASVRLTPRLDADEFTVVQGGKNVSFVMNVQELRPLAADEERNFTLYLPARGALQSVEIGVPTGTIVKPVPSAAEDRVVWYGTSIVHGAAAQVPQR